MTGSLWSSEDIKASAQPLEGELLRLVESQEQIATNRLVTSLEEQALLEELLETTKPKLAEATPAGVHYLLATPFRYPPLRHGSRFGRRSEPGLFYGSRNPATVLAESAYYRLVFWTGMETPPAQTLTTQHTLFGAGYRCAQGLRLQAPPFSAHQQQLTDKADYRITQALGTAMREAGIEAFEFISARDPQAGINIALFTPAALSAKRPRFTQEWLAETAAWGVRFYCPETREVRTFDLGLFVLENAELPVPAA